MGPKRDCACPVARHEHGTRLAYIRDKCRCDPCRQANTASERVRNRAKLYGRYDGLVDAEPVREHVRMLAAHGVGLKTISRRSGVGGGVLTKLMYGHPLPDGSRRAPSRRVTPRVRDRILSVQPDALAPRAVIDATGTRRRLQALVAVGWSQSELARALNMAPTNFGKVVRNSRVTKATADAVRALYDELWDMPPVATGHREKIAYARTLRLARENGWMPPLAWDDDTIDDPAAVPMQTAEDSDDIDEIAVERIMAGTLTVPRHAQSPERFEAIRRLATRGLSDSDIGRRVGMASSAVCQARLRHGIPAGVPSTRVGAA